MMHLIPSRQEIAHSQEADCAAIDRDRSQVVDEQQAGASILITSDFA